MWVGATANVTPGRSHYSVIGGEGWEEVADYALEWAEANAKHPAAITGHFPAKSIRPPCSSVSAPAVKYLRWTEEVLRMGSDDPGALGFAAGLQPGEELVYLLADDLLALQQGVAHALDDRALFAQDRLYLLAGLGE